MNSVSKALTCGRLAALAGVSADTVRHYERRGLLPPAPRSAKGYRLYPAGSLERVQLIRRALAIGFTISELAEVLHERDSGRPPCRRVRELADTKLVELQRRQQELAGVCAALRRVLKHWDRRLTATPAGRPARLLDALLQESRNGATVLISPFSPRVRGNRKLGANR
jgi:DNA-binding transcriptional MerR regulator